MKRLILLISIINTCFLFSSCDDDFFSHQPSFYTEENVFSNVGLAEGVINSMLRGRITADNFDRSSLVQVGGDDVYSFNTSAFTSYANGNIAADNGIVNSIWTNAYKHIRSANEFIENAVSVANWGADQDRLLGEAYFMRAYYYFELLHYFGGKGYGVPLIYHAQQIDEDVYVDRSSFGVTIDSIYADLDRATNLLPTPDEALASRPNRGVAMGYKSRVSLYAASPMNNPENEASLWEFAAQAAKALIDAGYYQLHTDYDGIFREDNPELIFFYESNDQIIASYMDLFVQSPANTGQTLITPTQNLVDCYEVLENGGRVAVPFDWNNPAHAANPYANRDPRLAASVLCHGSPWKDGAGADRLIDLLPTGIDMTASLTAYTRTGYFVRKLADPDYYARVSAGGRSQTMLNFIQMRYAEIILNYAETQLKLGNPIEAANYINLIRTRPSVDMPPISAGELTWDRYVNERRVELAFEEHRYFDVRRWGESMEVFNTIYYGVNVSERADQSIMYTYKSVIERQYPENMDILPIPQSDFDKLQSAIPGFQQNPGW